MHDLATNPDRSEASPGRVSVWIPMAVWLLMLSTFVSFRERQGSELWDSGGIDLQTKFRIVAWLALGLLALCLLVRGRADWRLLRRGPMLWYSCYVAVALGSTLYSPCPALTAFRSLQHAVAIVLVISMREHLRSIYPFIVAYIVVNWALVLMCWAGLDFGLQWIRDPDDQRLLFAGSADTRWRFSSALGHPSSIAIMAAVGAVGLAARTRGRHWLVWGPLIALLMLTTVLTVSRTAIAALAGGMMVVAIGRRVLLPFACLVGVVVPLLLLSPDVSEVTARYLARGQSEQEMQSLTGRLSVYEKAMYQADESLPFGGGFRAGRKNPLEEGWFHSHNMLLESLYCLGLPGFLFSTFVLITLAASVCTILWQRQSTSSPDSTCGWQLCAMLVPLYAFCILDCGFVADMDPVCMAFLVVIALAQTVLLDEKLVWRQADNSDGTTRPSWARWADGVLTGSASSLRNEPHA